MKSLLLTYRDVRIWNSKNVGSGVSGGARIRVPCCGKPPMSWLMSVKGRGICLIEVEVEVETLERRSVMESRCHGDRGHDRASRTFFTGKDTGRTDAGGDVPRSICCTTCYGVRIARSRRVVPRRQVEHKVSCM